MDDKLLATQVTLSGHAVAAEATKANLAHLSQTRLELMGSAVKAGESVLKMLLVINGGAAVALLAFLGNVLPKEAQSGAHFSVLHMKAAMVRFMAGVVAVGVGAVFRFLALYAAMLRRERAEGAFSWAALAAGLVSLGAFVCGGMWVVGGVR